MARPHGRARVNTRYPEAFAQCDRCSFWYNRTELQWQQQWSATHLYNLGFLVCKKCLDIPFEQLRTIILPPDPPPIINARPPGFRYPVQPGDQEYGPIQGALAITALDRTNVLTLLPAEGSLQDASSFSVGSFVWIYLNSGVFDYIQISAIDVVANTLTLADILSARAPVNGSVTQSVPGVVPPGPTLSSAIFAGTGSLTVNATETHPPGFIPPFSLGLTNLFNNVSPDQDGLAAFTPMLTISGPVNAGTGGVAHFASASFSGSGGAGSGAGRQIFASVGFSGSGGA